MGCVAHSNSHSANIHLNGQQGRSSAGKKEKNKQKAVDNRIKSLEARDAPTAVIETKAKTQKDNLLIAAALKRHFIFNSLDSNQTSQVVNEMKYYTIDTGENVFEQNSVGNNFFIVATGKVEVLINGVKKAVLRPGDSFGEVALLHGTLRMATIKTLEKSCFWSIDRKTFRNVAYSINSLNYRENKAFIENVSLFHVLTDDQKEHLLNSLNTQTFPAGTNIVSDGDPGELFYLIKEGRVSVTKNGSELREMSKGDYFGEQALLYKQNRTATVQTITNVTCLSIASDALSLALGSKLQHIIYRNSVKISLENDEFLKKLNQSQISAISESIQVYSYKPGQIVANQGTCKSLNLFVVLKGSLKSGEKTFELFSCAFSQQFCGKVEEGVEEELIAAEDSDVGVISIEHFEKLISGHYAEITVVNDIVRTLKAIPLLSNLKPEVLQRIVKNMKVVEMEAGEFVFNEGQDADFFFIIKTGELEVWKNSKPVRVLYSYDYFGERSLLFNSKRTATVRSKTKVELWCLKRDNFLSDFSDTIKTQLLRRIELQDTKVKLSDLYLLKTIGKGTFGNVFLVSHKKRGTTYALKTVDRKKIQAYSIHSNVILERKVLLLLDHPMIMKLVKTFKDSDRIYFLLEHVMGQDMFDVLRTLQILRDADAKFYAACLINILEHVHSKGIVYRDLKPENIVIDYEGYPKLIDFGISKIVSGRTFSMVGTPHYMAVEIIEGKGYGHLVDYWSLGVVIYELICGGLPFGDEEEEPYAIYEKILEHNLTFPQWVENNSAAQHLIEQLLSPNPSLRIGGTSEAIYCHPWFMGLNWDKLSSKQLKPPFIPNTQNANISKDNKKNLDPAYDFMKLIKLEEDKEQLNSSNAGSETFDDWDKEF